MTITTQKKKRVKLYIIVEKNQVSH